MPDSTTNGRMQLSFLEYYSLLRTNELKSVTEKSHKAATMHVFSEVRPARPSTQIVRDLELSHLDIRANFDGSIAHALFISAASEEVDNGNPKSYKSKKYSL